MSERVMALAGVLQSTELVRLAARTGTWPGFAAETCLDSLLALDAESVDDVYGGPSGLGVGFDTLESILTGSDRHIDALRYAVTLLQVERSLKRAGNVQKAISDGLARIARERDVNDEDRTAAAAARLYGETVSTLKPRVVVNGQPVHLKTERTVHWIRTLLFAGLRSAVLWRQVGGGRFSLLLGRGRLLRELREVRAAT